MLVKSRFRSKATATTIPATAGAIPRATSGRDSGNVTAHLVPCKSPATMRQDTSTPIVVDRGGRGCPDPGSSLDRNVDPTIVSSPPASSAVLLPIARWPGLPARTSSRARPAGTTSEALVAPTIEGLRGRDLIKAGAAPTRCSVGSDRIGYWAIGERPSIRRRWPRCPERGPEPRLLRGRRRVRLGLRLRIVLSPSRPAPAFRSSSRPIDSRRATS